MKLRFRLSSLQLRVLLVAAAGLLPLAVITAVDAEIKSTMASLDIATLLACID